ncbi:unnamed protein product, partial [Sphagnum balticum]
MPQVIPPSIPTANTSASNTEVVNAKWVRNQNFATTTQVGQTALQPTSVTIATSSNLAPNTATNQAQVGSSGSAGWIDNTGSTTVSVTSMTWVATSGGLATINFSLPPAYNIVVGNSITISGATNSGTGGNGIVNGSFVIQAVNSATQVVLTMSGTSVTIGTIGGAISAALGVNASVAYQSITSSILHGSDTSSLEITISSLNGDPTSPLGPAHMAYYALAGFADATIGMAAGHQYSLIIWVYSATSGIPVWFWTRNNGGQLEHYGSKIATTVAGQWVQASILACPQAAVTPDVRISVGAVGSVYISSFTVYDVTPVAPYKVSVNNQAVMPASYAYTGYYGFGWDNGVSPVTLTYPFTANQVTQTTPYSLTNNLGFPDNGWRLWDNVGLNLNGTNLNWTGMSGNTPIYNPATWIRVLQIAQVQNQQVIYTVGDFPTWLQYGNAQVPTSNAAVVALVSSLATIAATQFPNVPLTFELGNEVNTSIFFGGTVNYGSIDLVTLAYSLFTAIKSISSKIKVIAPNVTQYGSGYLVSFEYPWPGRTYNGSQIAWDYFSYHNGVTNNPVYDINVLVALNFILSSIGKSSTPLLMTESQYDYSGTPTTQQYQAAVGTALLMVWEQGAQIFNWYLCNIPPGGTAPYFASLLSPTDGVTKPTTITTSGGNRPNYTGNHRTCIGILMKTLHLGVDVETYEGLSTTTETVADYLEDNYNIIQTFYVSQLELISKVIEEDLEYTIQALISGAPPPVDTIGPASQEIEARFIEFIEGEELANYGIAGVPTKAALAGKHHGTKTFGPRRPSFDDTDEMANRVFRQRQHGKSDHPTLEYM